MILLIDSYDSFTNNLSLLLSKTTGKKVTTIHNDTFLKEEYEHFRDEYLQAFEYVVIGPGPGHPANDEDIGIVGWLLRQYRDNRLLIPIPILGICLGFQSICYEFGNPVIKLNAVKHGQIYDVAPIGPCELFSNLSPFKSVRYHSLHVPEVNDEIVPLAFTTEAPNTKILMAMKHKSLPFFGVQYHPESICSSKGQDLVKNFTTFADKYNKLLRPSVFGVQTLTREFLSHSVRFPYLIEGGSFLKSNSLPDISVKKFTFQQSVTPTDVCDYLYKKDKKSDFILLNSASVPGEWSIIGLPIEGISEMLTHSVDDIQNIYKSTYNGSDTKVRIGEGESVWTEIASGMKEHYIPREVIEQAVGSDFHSRKLPFWGGYLGLISYEEGQHIVVKNLKSLTHGNTPDLKLVFIERFIVHDHTTNDWFIISIRPRESDWVNELYSELTHEVKPIDPETIPNTIDELCLPSDKLLVEFDFPSQDAYRKQFSRCQEILHNGDSYELCLTTLLKVTLPLYISAWDIYKVLTIKKNPSPFSGFMDFSDCTLISSSPERFLSWKDNNTGNKLVELRPIKGTVRNTPDVTLEDATKILKTPKEMGENLMIVDLIRHDLYQFTENVEVTQLMSVEEYKTVFQLVSVIQGTLPPSGYHGIDILHQSLPPGSMTGAPKKRSVELLHQIESMQANSNPGGRRGIYSGVMGYWSITDDADWSVIIRSVFRYENDLLDKENTHTWRLGAGGAITVLSDEQGEWEEMELKLSSALQAFK